MWRGGALGLLVVAAALVPHGAANAATGCACDGGTPARCECEAHWGVKAAHISVPVLVEFDVDPQAEVSNLTFTVDKEVLARFDGPKKIEDAKSCVPNFEVCTRLCLEPVDVNVTAAGVSGCWVISAKCVWGKTTHTTIGCFDMPASSKQPRAAALATPRRAAVTF